MGGILFVNFIPCNRKRAVRVAVISIFEGDDFLSSSVTFS
jgi:hypothetical protein